MSRKKSSGGSLTGRPPQSRQSSRFPLGPWTGLLGLAGLAVLAWLLWNGFFQGSANGPPRQYRLQVLRRIPHDPKAFTQGLLWHQGKLYESTGRYGESSLRRINPGDGRVEAVRRVESDLFGEGLARVGSELWMLTWQEETALIFDLQSLRPLRRLSYRGEGWGLCHDGRRFIMSDGSHRLTFRDSATFEVEEVVEVLLGELPVRSLNELECVDEYVYANVWQRNVILKIDPDRGRVVGQVDALGLLRAEESRDADVLNGIAYDSENDSFYLTGKLWPALFEVRFVEQ
ncbi:MAG TPA: glutaminyl-peptide cyclotransferase [Acidobacteriota bacterium]|nr:glutaminyl-peptide cyclotransferase [Acidobacteriota bacterium]